MKTNETKVSTANLAKVHASKMDNPVDFVRQFVARKGKTLGRAECVRQLVSKHGVAFYTARTQFQRVHSMGYKLPKVPKAKATKPAAVETPASA